jgi:hypothetical protein
MARIEDVELQAHRNAVISDVKKLVGEYRAIFDWDVPEIDQKLADKLILAEVRKSLDALEQNLIG